MAPQERFKLVMERGPNPGREFEITQPKIILGRADSKEVQYLILTPEVSRRHACITRTGDHFLIQDLGSSNGTFINDERITGEPHPLQPGDRIRLSSAVTIGFHLHKA